jgi:hypothetical protein
LPAQAEAYPDTGGEEVSERPTCHCGHEYDDHAFSPMESRHPDCENCGHWEYRAPYCCEGCSCMTYYAPQNRNAR